MNMSFKYYLLLCLVSCSDAFGFFRLRNGFKHIVDEINSLLTVYQMEKFPPQWITQKLDHFDPIEKRTWNMKYYENRKFWKENGPIFLLIGGESAASSSFLRTGTMYELAKETNGAMFVSEHRYYGESKPVNGTTPEDFKFLNTRQALADIATLIENIKTAPPFNGSHVIVVGGSYAGNLAAWMKVLYPNLIDAAISSSGPVLAKKDFFEYLEKVKDDFEQYGTESCVDDIEKMFQRYELLMQNSTGINQLKKENDICDDCDMTIIENQQTFFISMASEFMGVAQYGTTNNIKKKCSNLNTSSHKFSDGLWNEESECYDYSFDAIMEEYRKKENNWILSWVYQTCTEYGYFQTTNSDSQPFINVPLDFYIKMCSALFGKDFDEARVDRGITSLNDLFGGIRPNVTRVVFTNGDLDPWSTLSVLEDISYDAPAIVIPRASHCRDLFSNRKRDHEELKEARKHVKYLIKQWIGFTDGD